MILQSEAEAGGLLSVQGLPVHIVTPGQADDDAAAEGNNSDVIPTQQGVIFCVYSRQVFTLTATASCHTVLH